MQQKITSSLHVRLSAGSDPQLAAETRGMSALLQALIEVPLLETKEGKKIRKCDSAVASAEDYDELQGRGMCVCDLCAICYAAVRDAVMAENSLFIALYPFHDVLRLSDNSRTALVFQVATDYIRGEAISKLKGSWTFWSAKALKNDVPDISFSPYMYPGIYRARFMRLMIGEKRFALGQALLISKRACAVVSQDMVSSTLQKTVTMLCKTQPSEEPSWFRSEIRRTVREVFDGSDFMDYVRDASMLVPSMRACMDIQSGNGQEDHPIKLYDQECRDRSFETLVATCTKLGQDWRKVLREFTYATPTWFMTGKASRDLHWLPIFRLAARIKVGGAAVGGRREALGTLGLVQRYLDDKGALASYHLADADFIGYVGNKTLLVEVRDKRHLIWDILEDYMSSGRALEMEHPRVQPVPIRESLKVRVITKGPARLQYYGRFLQKFLWSTAKKHPTFKLTGSSVNTQIMSTFFANCRPDLGFKMVSGDYTAATDRLQSWASTHTWDEVCDVASIPDDLRALGHTILTDHVFLTPDGDEMKQTNGQLMGSVISFIILCLVNACANRYAMEQTAAKQARVIKDDLEGEYNDCGWQGEDPAANLQRNKRLWAQLEELEFRSKMDLVDCNMLINGDDCLFELFAETHEEHYKYWQSTLGSVGLEMSKGKNYIAVDFAVINSRMFRPVSHPIEEQSLLCDWEWVDHSYEIVQDSLGVPNKVKTAKCSKRSIDSAVIAQCGGLVSAEVVHFVNPGLVMGLGRVAGGDEEGELADEGPVARAWRLYDDCDPRIVEAVYEDLYLFFNSDDIKEISHDQQSWYLPRYCGGLGLPPKKGFSIDHVSPAARQVMRGLLNDADPTRSLSLFRSAGPKFVEDGTEQINAYCRALEIKPKLVHIWEYNSYTDGNKDSYAQTYFPYCLNHGQTAGSQRNNFEQLIHRYRKVTPGDALPGFERHILVPGLQLGCKRDMGDFLNKRTHTPTEEHLSSLIQCNQRTVESKEDDLVANRLFAELTTR